MEIWLDTIDFEVIKDAKRLGIIAGVTTNPSILSKAKNILDTLRMLLEIQPGCVAAQVTSDTAAEMVVEGKRIYNLSNRMVVKVPTTRQGLMAMVELKEHGIPILATGILTPAQALLAYNLGVEIIAPYFSHMENAAESLKMMQEICPATTSILAASLREVDHILFCARLGIDAITIKPDLYHQLVSDHPATQNFCEKFALDWQSNGHVSILK